MPTIETCIWQALKARVQTLGLNGPNPITIEAIDAFIRTTGLQLDPRDIDLIEAVDDLYLAKTAEQQASDADRQQAIKDRLASVGKGQRSAAR